MGVSRSVVLWRDCLGVALLVRSNTLELGLALSDLVRVLWLADSSLG